MARESNRQQRGGRDSDLQERVVEINRVAKVVKGGRRFSFTALVVVGDEKSKVGVGYGKANEVPVAIQKGVERARRDLKEVPMHGSTITHQVTGVHSASRVLLKPASQGTGVIAGGGVRAVLELAGIHDVLSKSLGSQNPINLVKATMAALEGLRRPEDVAKLRGLTVAEVLGLDEKEKSTVDSRQSTEAGRGGVDPGVKPHDHQVRSPNGASKKQRESLRTLGLGRIGKHSERPDDAVNRGLLRAVSHLVEVK